MAERVKRHQWLRWTMVEWEEYNKLQDGCQRVIRDHWGLQQAVADALSLSSNVVASAINRKTFDLPRLRAIAATLEHLTGESIR